MTKQMKDELRARHMKERDAYELANLGHFNRCYPSQNSQLQDKYDKIHQVSLMMWNDQNGTRPRDNSLVVNTPLYQGPGGAANQAKTNAGYFNKSKALDLTQQPSLKQQDKDTSPQLKQQAT